MRCAFLICWSHWFSKDTGSKSLMSKTIFQRKLFSHMKCIDSTPYREMKWPLFSVTPTMSCAPEFTERVSRFLNLFLILLKFLSYVSQPEVCARFSSTDSDWKEVFQFAACSFCSWQTDWFRPHRSHLSLSKVKTPIFSSHFTLASCSCSSTP